MSVRMNLSIGESLDAWISEKSAQLGIAKNAFVIMCVANARQQEENAKMMNAENMDIFRKLLEQEEKSKEGD